MGSQAPVGGVVWHGADMNDDSSRIAWGMIAHPGDVLARDLCELFGPAEALARVLAPRSHAATLSLVRGEVTGGDRKHLGTLHERYDADGVSASLLQQVRAGIGVLHPSHPAWPARLADLGEAAPLALWFRGNPEAATTLPVLAVVGSRRPSGAGLGNATSIVAGTWSEGVAVLSGGAAGIDTVAHQASLIHQRVPLCVLAGGLESVYPSENTALMSQIEERGAVFSEAPCGLRIRPERFLARNRLIAALSDGVVVVEAAYRSGAINTAHHAAGLGREIGVVPGRWGDPATRGCFRIARDVGAMVLTEAADVGFLLPGMPGVHA